jgi:Fic family protein
MAHGDSRAQQNPGIDVTPWVLWYPGVFARGYQHSMAALRLSADKAAFWQLCAGVDLNPRQRKVIERLLDVGDGGFLGGLSAEKYMRLAQTSKATATHDLVHLYENGLLAAQGQGKARRYAVAMLGWNADFERINPGFQAQRLA